MQLRNARLCLDCEEVHDSDHCPSCASETFAFITRWVPAPERRSRPRPVDATPVPETLDTYRQMLEPEKKSNRWTLVQGGAVGLAVFGIARWLSQGNADQEPRRSSDQQQQKRGG